MKQVEVRLDYISKLGQGWYYGEGKSYQKEKLNSFLEIFTQNYITEFSIPAIYPDVEGGLQLEWTNGIFDVSLTIDLDSMIGEFHAINFIDDNEDCKELDLNIKSSWNYLNEYLEKRFSK